MSHLICAKNRNSTIYAWRLILKKSHFCQVKIESIKKNKKEILISSCDDDDNLHDLFGNQAEIDLYIPDASILLRLSIKNFESSGKYHLSLPDFIVQIERRKSLRINTYESSDLKVNFLKTIIMMRATSQLFQKTCFDISTGGFAFLVSKMELKFFKKDDPIINIDLRIKNFKSTVSAQVKTILEIEPDEFNGLPYKVWRVSCSFVGIDDITKKHIEKYIFERINQDLSAINE